MRLLLERQPSKGGATIGSLFIDGEFFCYVCEDVIREQPGQPVEAWKVPGKTAIPAGEYGVVVTMSNRFKRRLPLLENVPGFAGIRIHPGNTSEDTEGCLLPGLAKTGNQVLSSRAAFDLLFAKINAACNDGAAVTIEIRNPPQ